MGTVSALSAAPRVAQVAVLAALCTLTRPDGLLFCVATAAWAIVLPHRSLRERLLGLLAMIPVPLHLLWRYATYGDWLPNTHYAKVVEPWPEAGARYLASFVLEYSLWLWVPMAVWALAASGRKLGRQHLPAMVVAGALVAHSAYYVLIAGGDHFEYRVFVHWIVLAMPLLLCLCDLAGRSARTTAVVGVAALLASLPIPWTHWSLTKDLYTRRETQKMRVPVAPHLPQLLLPITATFDALQEWMIPKSIGMRHQEHKVFFLAQSKLYPSRQALLAGARDQGGAWILARQRPESGALQLDHSGSVDAALNSLPVHMAAAVGVAAWVMPDVAILDIHGLNDAVIAKQGRLRPRGRQLAHDRLPPDDYLSCFSPNVWLQWIRMDETTGQLQLINTRKTARLIDVRVPLSELDPPLIHTMLVEERTIPLTDKAVHTCERRDWRSQGD